MTRAIEPSVKSKLFDNRSIEETLVSQECTAKKIANQIGKAIFIGFIGAFNCSMFLASITALTLAVEKKDDKILIKNMAIIGSIIGPIFSGLVYTIWKTLQSQSDSLFLDT